MPARGNPTLLVVRIVCLAAAVVIAFAFGRWLRDPSTAGTVIIPLAAIGVALASYRLLGPNGLARENPDSGAPGSEPPPAGLPRSATRPAQAPPGAAPEAPPVYASPTAGPAHAPPGVRPEPPPTAPGPPPVPATPYAPPAAGPVPPAPAERPPPASSPGPTRAAPPSHPGARTQREEAARERVRAEAVRAREALDAGGATARQGAPIDLNSASVEQLATLGGVGPVAARRIVDDRAANGRFASVAELGRVPGFTPERVAQLEAQGLVAS